VVSDTTTTKSHRATDQPEGKAPLKRIRFNALTKEQTLLFERAAALYGQSVSQFVMNNAQHVAEQMMREHEVIVLPARTLAAV